MEHLIKYCIIKIIKSDTDYTECSSEALDSLLKAFINSMSSALLILNSSSNISGRNYINLYDIVRNRDNLSVIGFRLPKTNKEIDNHKVERVDNYEVDNIDNYEVDNIDKVDRVDNYEVDNIDNYEVDNIGKVDISNSYDYFSSNIPIELNYEQLTDEMEWISPLENKTEKLIHIYDWMPELPPIYTYRRTISYSHASSKESINVKNKVDQSLKSEKNMFRLFKACGSLPPFINYLYQKHNKK